MTPADQYFHEELPNKAIEPVRSAHRPAQSFAFYGLLIEGVGLLVKASGHAHYHDRDR
jgi:hypothetical protein